MEFEWDLLKADLNREKHGVDFADAALVLYDDEALTIRDDEYPERFVTVGMDAQGRILVVVHTWRGRAVRLISARKATPRERRQYVNRT